MEKDKQKKVAEEREFQSSQLDKQLQVQTKESQLKHDREVEIENIKGQYRLKEENIASLGKAADRESNQQGYDEINRAAQESINNDFRSQEIGIKQQEQQRKVNSDKESKRIEMEKLAQKSEELRIRELQARNNLTQSIINKN